MRSIDVLEPYELSVLLLLLGKEEWRDYYHIIYVLEEIIILSEHRVLYIISSLENRTEVYIMNIRRTIECIEIIFENISANIIIIEQ
jgi:hypothetical protein